MYSLDADEAALNNRHDDRRDPGALKPQQSRHRAQGKDDGCDSHNHESQIGVETR
jgi:hypothetical protein